MSAWLDEYGRLRVGWRFLLGLVVAFLANVAALAVADAIAGLRPRLLDAIYRPLAMVLLLAGFSLLLVLADRVRGNPLAAMGLGRIRWVRQFALGLAIGAGMICAAMAGIALGGQLSFLVSWNGRAGELMLLELTVLVTGALMEELMFRGYPFQRLVDGVGPSGAVVIVSVLFGMVHLGNPHASVWGLVNTILVGALLSVAYLRTRSLWLPFGIHFAWNAVLGMAFGLPVSGLTQFAVVVHGMARGPRWLTGGAYGIEASALGTLVILLGFVPLLLVTRPCLADRQPDQALAVEPANPRSSPDQEPLGRIQP